METSLAVPSDIQDEVSGLVLWAQSLRITTPGEYETAAEKRRCLVRGIDRVEEFFKPHTVRADEAHKALVADKNRVLAPLKEARQITNKEMLRYELDEKAKALAEQQKLQAEADERARRERERLEAQAAKLKTPEKQAERLEQAAAVIAPVIYVPSAKPKVAGISTRKTWVVDTIDKAALVAAVAQRPDLLAYLMVDESALLKVGKATHGEIEIPGVTFREEYILAGSGR